MLSKLTVTASPELIWAVLMHEIGKPATFIRDENGPIRFFGHEKKGENLTRRVMGRLRFPKNAIDTVATCVKYHMQLKDAQNMRTATLRKLFLRPHFMTELELHRIDCLCSSGRLDNFIYLKKQFEAFDAKPELKESYINGDDLISLGQQPGPDFGLLLQKARDRQLEGEITSRKQALGWLKAQVEEIASINKQIDSLDDVNIDILPLLKRMVDALGKFISIDIPFLLDERTNRVKDLDDLIIRADVTTAEKFRKIFEAYQLEAEFGKTIESYQGYLVIDENEKAVDYFRLGRLGLFYRTPDGNDTGYWSANSNDWIHEGSSLDGSLKSALDIANRQSPPNFITLPIKPISQ